MIIDTSKVSTDNNQKQIVPANSNLFHILFKFILQAHENNNYKLCLCISFIIIIIKVAVNKEGTIQYLKNDIYQDAGCSLNEAFSALLLKPFTNCYDATRWGMKTNSVITDTPSNTWCRAPCEYLLS